MVVELKSTLNEYPEDYVKMFDDNFQYLDISDDILKLFRQEREKRKERYKREVKLAVCMCNFPNFLFTADMNYIDRLLVISSGRLYIPEDEWIFNQYKAYVNIGGKITNKAWEINDILRETRERREIIL